MKNALHEYIIPSVYYGGVDGDDYIYDDDDDLDCFSIFRYCLATRRLLWWLCRKYTSDTVRALTTFKISIPMNDVKCLYVYIYICIYSCVWLCVCMYVDITSMKGDKTRVLRKKKFFVPLPKKNTQTEKGMNFYQTHTHTHINTFNSRSTIPNQYHLKSH